MLRIGGFVQMTKERDCRADWRQAEDRPEVPGDLFPDYRFSENLDFTAIRWWVVAIPGRIANLGTPAL